MEKWFLLFASGSRRIKSSVREGSGFNPGSQRYWLTDPGEEPEPPRAPTPRSLRRLPLPRGPEPGLGRKRRHPSEGKGGAEPRPPPPLLPSADRAISMRVSLAFLPKRFMVAAVPLLLGAAVGDSGPPHACALPAGRSGRAPREGRHCQGDPGLVGTAQKSASVTESSGRGCLWYGLSCAGCVPSQAACAPTAAERTWTACSAVSKTVLCYQLFLSQIQNLDP